MEEGRGDGATPELIPDLWPSFIQEAEDPPREINISFLDNPQNGFQFPRPKKRSKTTSDYANSLAALAVYLPQYNPLPDCSRNKFPASRMI